MLKETLRRYFAKRIYPTYRGDWYKLKGYDGSSPQMRFNDFVKKQSIPESLYYQEFKNLNLIRQFVDSGNFKLDSVRLKPNKSISQDKPGYNLYIICFHGRSEYYESKFRDMALMARETGATIIGFNPKGFHSSTGKTKTIHDIVNDGIALIESLLAENISPKQIVFYGNSLGGAVQALVCKHFQKLNQVNFRQINSNSFRTLSGVFAAKMRLPFLEKQLYTIMKYSGWEIDYNRDFYKTGIYRCYLTRANDRTILVGASFVSKVSLSADLKNAPTRYQDTMQWLIDNSELIVDNSIKGNKPVKDPHDLNLYRLCLKAKNAKGENLKVWEFFNRYLEASNRFV